MRVLATWIAAACIAAEGAVEVTKALKGELYNDESVVTDVRVDLGGYATTGGVAAATNAAAAELGGRLADATNAVMGRMDVRVDGATNAVAAELGGRLADATNAAMEAVEGMLGAYATREWLAAQGFARESGLAAYATREWALGQDWATKGWIDSLGLLARGDLAGYATADWVRGQGYATRDEIGEAVQRRFGELAAQTNVSYRLSEEDGTAWLRLYGGDAFLTRVDADGTNEAALATMDWTSGYVNESVGAVATEASAGIAGVYASLEAGSVPVAASEVPWDGVKDTPTTLAGYGVAEDATNIVCGIVTNAVHSFGDWVEEWNPPNYGSVYSLSGPYYEGGETWSGFYGPKKGMGIDRSFSAAGGEFATRLVFVGDAGGTNFTLTLTRSDSAENALGLAMAKDLEKLPNHETVTNIVRKVVNTAGRYVWDKDLEVCYRLNAAGGFLDLVAVTNVDVTMSENWAALEAIENEWGAK